MSVGRWKGTTTLQRFWGKVKKSESCWIRTGSGNGEGYSKFKITETGKREYGHRYSWQIHRGPIPKRLFVLHKCDNPPCVNPNHLFIGTHSDNMKDCARKGRNTAQRNPRMGESAPRSKLSTGQVMEIRGRYRGGERIFSIAKDYPLTQTSIRDIVKGKSYRNISL